MVRYCRALEDTTEPMDLIDVENVSPVQDTNDTTSEPQKVLEEQDSSSLAAQNPSASLDNTSNTTINSNSQDVAQDWVERQLRKNVVHQKDREKSHHERKKSAREEKRRKKAKRKETKTLFMTHRVSSRLIDYQQNEQEDENESSRNVHDALSYAKKDGTIAQDASRNAHEASGNAHKTTGIAHDDNMKTHQSIGPFYKPDNYHDKDDKRQLLKEEFEFRADIQERIQTNKRIQLQSDRLASWSRRQLERITQLRKARIECVDLRKKLNDAKYKLSCLETHRLAVKLCYDNEMGQRKISFEQRLRILDEGESIRLEELAELLKRYPLKGRIEAHREAERKHPRERMDVDQRREQMLKKYNETEALAKKAADNKIAEYDDWIMIMKEEVKNLESKIKESEDRMMELTEDFNDHR